eukprot:12051.XXX_740795_740992_1 [CDS] Oithona nana genome sequencing.
MDHQLCIKKKLDSYAILMLKRGNIQNYNMSLCCNSHHHPNYIPDCYFQCHSNHLQANLHLYIPLQ